MGRHLYVNHHNAPGDGNISARISERYLLCTPTQMHKGELLPSDIVKVRIKDGVGVDGVASSEIRMHLGIYRVRPDIKAIVHAHSVNAVGLTVAGVSMERPVVPEAIQTMGGIPTVPYASPTTADVADAVLPFAMQYNAFILERHGTVALGETLPQALARLEVVEHTAKITAIAIASGGATPIPPEEAERLLKMAQEAGVYRKPQSAPKFLSSVDQDLVDRLTEKVLEKLKG